MTSTAIIGGGVAGLACAARLAKAGQQATVFDKGRGPGGRLSTRRAQTPLGELQFDHGAQYFTARTQGFADLVKSLRASGHVDVWTGRHLAFDAEGGFERLDAQARYVGTPGMNGLVKGMIAALPETVDVSFASRVGQMERDSAARWSLKDDAGETLGTFDAVVCATPVEQACVLLASCDPQLAAEAEAAGSDPCWALMLAFKKPLPLDFDGAKFRAQPFSWAARNASKPGRGAGETWVIHGSPDWSKDHLENDADDVAERLASAFSDRFDLQDKPVLCSAHRWRYSQVATPATSPFALDADKRLGVCGDWRIGPRIEDAWTSGDQLGAALAGLA